jgi:hypothetical protein
LAVVADVVDGYVTPGAAERTYGVVVHPDGTWQPTTSRLARASSPELPDVTKGSLQ